MSHRTLLNQINTDCSCFFASCFQRFATMNNRLSITILLVIFAVAIGAKPRVKWPKVVLLGDSLTELSYSEDGKWASILANKIVGIGDVLNRGASGYSSSDWKNVLDIAMDGIDTKSVATVSILLGTNDARKKVGEGNYTQNLDWIVRRLNKKYKIDDQNIIVICPPPVYENPFGIEPGMVEKYAKACVNYVRLERTNAINAHSIFSMDGRGSKLFVDGVHFSSEGSHLLAQWLGSMVQRKILVFRGGLEKNFPNVINILDL